MTKEEQILELLKTGKSVYLVGESESGKSWFAEHRLIPLIEKSGFKVCYFVDCDDIDENCEYDMVVIDEVESLLDSEYLEKAYPDEKPYYSLEYLEKVKSWVSKLQKIKSPAVYIITRATDQDVDYFQNNIKSTDWGSPVEVIVFKKNDR